MATPDRRPSRFSGGGATPGSAGSASSGYGGRVGSFFNPKDARSDGRTFLCASSLLNGQCSRTKACSRMKD
jgi:hypothetical protein